MSATPDDAALGRRPAAILAIGLALALAFAAIGLRRTTPPPSGLEGQRAPAAELPVLGPKPQPEVVKRRIPVAGKPLLLHFWGPSCGPCVEESPTIAKLHGEGRRTGAFEVITISAEDVAEIRSFLRDKEHGYPVLHDTTGYVHGQYRVSAIPASFVIGADGVIAKELRGPQEADTLRALLTGG